MAAVWESPLTDRPLRASRRVGAAIAIALHAGAVAALLAYEPARSALFAAAPIMVDWIAAPKAEPKVEPPPRPPKPKPVTRTPPPETPPILATAPQAPEPIVAPAPPPPPPPALVAVAPALAPVAITPPIFNAKYLDNPKPAYPALSRRLGEQGRVILRVRVSAAGRADEVQIGTSSGYPRLDETAAETVKQWKFVPAKRGTEAVADWVLIPVSFKLEG
jgi:protein TonB